LKADVGFQEVALDERIGKLSLVGVGMRTHSGIAAKMFETLAAEGINIEMISTSEIRISVVTRADSVHAAARAVHTAFELDGDEDAIVHAGTGR
jgi:aspartate kinase